MSDLPSLEHLTTQISEAVADTAALLRKVGLTPNDNAACLGAIHLLRYRDAQPDGAPDAEALLHAAIRVLKNRNPGVRLSALDSSAAVGLACDLGMAWHRLREWKERVNAALGPPPEADAPPVQPQPEPADPPVQPQPEPADPPAAPPVQPQPEPADPPADPPQGAAPPKKSRAKKP